ncbi:MAG: DUF1836 domain-containing protein [Clostridiales Family XIII bacterium]|jgi:hypothetical protein|nr:DUF1836 domain-containing protein [Clostridiales Family XIII bacterium]
MRYEEFLKNFAEEFAEGSIIEPEDFPDMDLYADQVSAFISSKLSIYGKDPLLTKSMVSSFVKKGLLPAPDKRRFSRDHVVLIELILLLSIAYRQKDVEAMMKPLIENFESVLDEKNEFYELYKKLVPIFKQLRVETAERVVGTVDAVKDGMHGMGADDDDTIELFLVLLAISMQVDTAMYIGKRLLREYFSDKPQDS